MLADQSYHRPSLELALIDENAALTRHRERRTRLASSNARKHILYTNILCSLSGQAARHLPVTSRAFYVWYLFAFILVSAPCTDV